MSGYDIGISGLNVAQRAIELIGNNIANAGTEGYHRQELKIVPVEFDTLTENMIMSGPRIQGVRRLIDSLLEGEITRQQPTMGQLEQELRALQSVENAFGVMGTGGLSTALGKFFGSLSKLAAEPTFSARRQEVVWAADTLAGQFRNLATFLINLDQQIQMEAQIVVEQVNNLSNEIAHLNEEIRFLTMKGGNPNMLTDRRDQALNELGRLVGATAESKDLSMGVVNVTAWGTPLVVDNQPLHLEVARTDDGKLGVSVKGAHYYMTDVRGGKLGGLLELKNELLPGIQGDLDILARQAIERINELHVQGVGANGPFWELRGTPVEAGTLDQWDSDVSSGQFTIRLIDPAGAATIHTITVDAAADTAATIRDKLNVLDPAHLSATIADSTLRIEGVGGWRFDFIPPVAVDASGLVDPSAPQVTASGIYTGEADETYTCTVVGTGNVGETAGLSIEVRNAAGESLGVHIIGTGMNGQESYSPTDFIEIDGGIRIALSEGALNDGETFTVQVSANSDPTGFLAAAGINTFFRGSSASTIAVRDDIKADASRIAVTRGTGAGGNANILRMAALYQAQLPALGGVTMAEFHRRIALDVGQGVAVRRARHDAVAQVLRQLENQRDNVSGVDINEEAARLLVFERMFQAMSRFIGAQDRNMDTLMELI